MSKHIIECFAELLESYVEGSIEDVSDLGTILESWGFITEDGELTHKGHALFNCADDIDERD